MIDIVGITDGQDLRLFDTEAPRAANILSVQEGALEYAPALGVDLKYFLESSVNFENESFKAYLIERLAFFGINVATVVDTVNDLYTHLTISVAESQQIDGLISR